MHLSTSSNTSTSTHKPKMICSCWRTMWLWSKLVRIGKVQGCTYYLCLLWTSEGKWPPPPGSHPGLPLFPTPLLKAQSGWVQFPLLCAWQSTAQLTGIRCMMEWVWECGPAKSTDRATILDHAQLNLEVLGYALPVNFRTLHSLSSLASHYPRLFFFLRKQKDRKKTVTGRWW